MAKKTALLLILFLTMSLPLSAETTILKSGKTVKGKIIERTDEYIKIDFHGVPLTRYLEDIESIDGVKVQTTTLSISSGDIPLEHIRRQLKDMGYPEHTWPELERELIKFLIDIDFPRLKEEVKKVKSDSQKLREFVAKIGRTIAQKEYINSQPAHPLIKLLVNSFGQEDIFSILETSLLTTEEKKWEMWALTACSATSQLGSILLDLLGLGVKAGFSKQHVFNSILLDDGRVLFVDFSNQVFELVDINHYYTLEGKYRILKEECRIPPERVREIKKHWQKEAQASTQKETLNYLYPFVYISDNYTITPSIHNNRGLLYDRIGDYDQAIAEYNQAIKIDPYTLEAYFNRGVIYEIQGDYDGALADYNQALQINPNYAIAYSNRGNVYTKKGNYDQAIAEYNQAIKIDPNYAMAYSNRGAIYGTQGDYDQAIAEYNQAIKIDPNCAIAYSNRGIAYSKKGNYDHAIADCNQAIKINPHEAMAYYNRGLIIYDNNGDLDHAIVDFSQSLQLNPNLVDAYIVRGVIYEIQGDYDGALADYSQALQINPNYAMAYYNRGNVYTKKGNYDQAIAEYTRTLDINPSVTAAHYNRAVLYFNQGDHTKAWEDVHKAQDLGYEADPQFLQELRRASGRER